jgi:hypothetical protein
MENKGQAEIKQYQHVDQMALERGNQGMVGF